MVIRNIGPLSILAALSVLLAACQPTTPAAPAKPTEAAKPADKPAEAAKPAPAATTAPAAQPAKPTEAAKPAAPSKPAQLTKLTIGGGAESATAAPIWIAAEHGIFAKYGIEPDLVQLTGGSQVSQALASNSAQVATGGLGAMLDAQLSGAELLVVGTGYPWQFFQIYAQPNIKTPQDLRGKTIAASDPGASSDRAVDQAMEKYGMKRDKDFNVTYVGGTKERLVALQQKVVDAAIISPPNGLLAGKEGFVKVVDLVAEEIPFGYSGLAASAKWAKDNPQLVEGFLKSYAEGLVYAKKNKEAAKAVIAKHTGAKDPEVLEESYELSVVKMKPLPYTEVSLVKLMLEMSSQPKAKTVDPATLIDNSYLKKIEESGFLKEIEAQ